MSYLAFHLVFILPPILVLAALQRRPLAGVGGLRARLALPLTALIAFAYTTPWDNYLVYRGVWTYGPDRVLATIGYVPVEEYFFFLAQPFLTGLWLFFLLSRARRPPRRPLPALFPTVVGFCFAITGLGVACLVSGAERATYLGLILAWAGPVLAGLWIYGGRHFSRYPGPLLLGVLVPTLYLWIADAIALRLGIWDVAPRFSLGIDLFGLPIEEAVFFLVTDLLVVQGAMLFLHGDRIPAPFGRTPSAELR